MTINFTKEQLAAWIANLKDLAKADTEYVVHWFGQTADKSLAIVGGWTKMFTDVDMSDIFCCSKSQPEYVMCVKIAINDGQVCPDFDTLNMPTDLEGRVDDTCIPLEWSDSPEYAAEFFMHELERISKAYV